eukprot:13974288-Alexandrium_andersonii.AAC.1
MTVGGARWLSAPAGGMRPVSTDPSPFDDPGGVDEGIGWSAYLDQFLDEVAVARVLAASEWPCNALPDDWAGRDAAPP